MNYFRMDQIDLQGKRVLIREDLNVPIDAGKVTSDARIRAALPTIKLAAEKASSVVIISHLGRPVEGEYDEAFSLAPVAEHISALLKRPVRFEADWLDGLTTNEGEIVLCENVRFLPGERSNDPELASKMAALCDVFVMDAFGTAHRSQASTEGLIRKSPVACAGPLLSQELDALKKSMLQPERPLLAVVGGSKVSTKLTVLESLLEKVDELIVGGGIANTFIAASGYEVGASLFEPDLIDASKKLMQLARSKGSRIPIPSDVVVAKSFSADAPATIRPVNGVAQDEMILDIGPQTADSYAETIKSAGTIVWNGPVGVFEFESFSNGTRTVAKAIAKSNAYSIAGGGDTLAAIDQFGVTEDVSYISTGGGAFLEFVEGKTLPAVAALQDRYEEV